MHSSFGRGFSEALSQAGSRWIGSGSQCHHGSIQSDRRGVSSHISAPNYSLADGTLQIEDIMVEMEAAAADLVYPGFVHLPLQLR